ncbi:MFS family permease [Chitinivorax tropicus]|uniref:MFS family permease n=1 Tax=Chitinivorax tropicus TaxID=714531 RepID=A0A840MMD4_9PROT|nr:hypothetical protein [Chitinivorax tropicus]MBB5018097.1 MFS family permease [Chitinivorax tropicus]
MELLVIKLFGAPMFIGLASMAGKRWGQAVAGFLGGLPMVAGPIILALWLQHGASFAAAAARAIPAGLLGIAAHILLFGLASQRFGWLASLLIGWAGFLVVGLGLVVMGQADQAWVSVAAMLSLILAARLVPHPVAPPTDTHLPKAELAARMGAALLLVVVLTTLASRLGTTLTGVLTVFPVASSVMPAFTFATAGRNALLVQLKGFCAGMTGLGAFAITVGLGLVDLGGWAFCLAVALSISTALIISHLLRRLEPTTSD